VIAGTQDVGTSLEHAEGLTARIRSADLAVLDSAHLSNVEQAEDFTEVLIAFLGD
jgi:3-oxoadipate enol-lactonase